MWAKKTPNMSRFLNIDAFLLVEEVSRPKSSMYYVSKKLRDFLLRAGNEFVLGGQQRNTMAMIH